MYRSKIFYRFIVVFIFLGGLSSCRQINAYLAGSKTTANDEKVDFFIPTHTTIEGLISLLVEENIIRKEDEKGMKNIIDYKEFKNNRIGSGKYEIAPHTNFKTLINGFTLNSLGNGNQEVEVNVTFNNCRDIFQVAERVSKQIELDSATFVNYLLSDSILRKYGFSKERIGALFLPNTYRFFWDTDEVEFVQRMSKEFKKFWTDARIAKIGQTGLKSQSDIVTLASVVYKEQDKYSQEWKTIAGLYLNRIKKGIRLESDPTFRYCWGDRLEGVERLTYEHRAIDCPYNTYLYAGLPPGPICIPPPEVVDAVLNYDKNDYLFMCAKPNGDGLHNFAVTLAQHNRNASEYQAWLRKYLRNK